MSDIETATTGEVQEAVQTPDAGENKKSFDELIEGDYRREYGEKVEAIVKSRLKNHTETKAKLGELTDMIVTLGQDMGMDSSDPREIITQLSKTKEEAEQMFYTSLERTGAGYFDFYLLHNLGEQRTHFFDDYDLWNFCAKRKEEGLIKHFGFSFHDKADVLDEILTAHP